MPGVCAPVQLAQEMAQQLGRGSVLLGQMPPNRPHRTSCACPRMKTLRLVLGDQLTRSVSALRGLDRAKDVVLLVEVQAETT